MVDFKAFLFWYLERKYVMLEKTVLNDKPELKLPKAEWNNRFNN